MTHRYGRSALAGEALRVGLGLAVMTIVWIAAGSGFFAWAAVILAVVFAAYGIGVALKAQTSISADKRGLSLARALPFPYARALAWPEIRGLRLDFFPERRDRTQGWFRFAATGENARIAFDSGLENFPSLVGEILHRTAPNGVAFSPVSLHNLKALKLDSSGAAPA